MDRDLLSAVLGRRVWPHALKPAVLRGYRRSSVRGASYPVVLRQRGASVAGVILSDPAVVLPGLAPAPQAVDDESLAVGWVEQKLRNPPIAVQRVS